MLAKQADCRRRQGPLGPVRSAAVSLLRKHAHAGSWNPAPPSGRGWCPPAGPSGPAGRPDLAFWPDLGPARAFRALAGVRVCMHGHARWQAGQAWVSSSEAADPDLLAGPAVLLARLPACMHTRASDRA
eukprot:NODE_2774_length_1043_cov_3.627767_g2319_i0.p2 GENE.NODE_2774_length_1043_cov_3.627767_g2319_i0~~NODE_2774_length_1043_cov_3.627767_g2319_i0.p2  ORF type:complete len:129 (-),score=0.10 NODE_2774_length_1043_cov_3.627767_g2319_i0:531-917(-)